MNNSFLITLLFIAVSTIFLTTRPQKLKLHAYRIGIFTLALFVLGRILPASEAFQGTAGAAQDPTAVATQINNLQTRAADLTKQIEKDNADLEALRRAAANSNSEIQKRRDEIAKLTPQFETAKKTADNLKSRIDTLRAQITALINSAGGRQMKTLTDRIAANQKLLTDIQAKLASLTGGGTAARPVAASGVQASNV